MDILISLLLTALVSPTLFDRSDLSHNCEVVTSRRAVSKQSVNNGIVQGMIDLEFGGSVGIVDERSSAYPPCDEFGERFYRADWLASATLSANEGLVVIENGVVVFRQRQAYGGAKGVIKITHQGTFLRYYLNGSLLFTSHHPNLASRDLRAYYFGNVEDPLIGVPRKLSRVFKQFTERGKVNDSVYAR